MIYLFSRVQAKNAVNCTSIRSLYSNTGTTGIGTAAEPARTYCFVFSLLFQCQLKEGVGPSCLELMCESFWGFSIRFDSLRFRMVRFCSVRFCSVRLFGFFSVQCSPVRFWSIRFGSVRFGLVRFDSVISVIRFGSVQVSLVMVWSVRFGSDRFGSVR